MIIARVVSQRLKEAGHPRWLQRYERTGPAAPGFMVCHAGSNLAEVWHCNAPGSTVLATAELTAYATALIKIGYLVFTREDGMCLTVRHVPWEHRATHDPHQPGPHDPPGPPPKPGDPPPPLPPRRERPYALRESALYPGMLSWHADETCARYSNGHKHLAAS